MLTTPGFFRDGTVMFVLVTCDLGMNITKTETSDARFDAIHLPGHAPLFRAAAQHTCTEMPSRRLIAEISLATPDS